MHRRASPSLAALLALATVCVAQSPTLIRDFNRTPNPNVRGSRPEPVAVLAGGDALLLATTPGFGRELWRSDGTAAGTRLVADVQPGHRDSDARSFQALPSGQVLFTATTRDLGRELWTTDGTSSGTHVVADIRPGTIGSIASVLLQVGGRVVFFADDGVHGIEPWVSDGTAAGTRMIRDVVANAGVHGNNVTLCPLGATSFVFPVFDPWLRVHELWTSDLTAAGTRRIARLPLNYRDAGPSYLTGIGSRAVFWLLEGSSRETLWSTDGTAAGTGSLGAEGRGFFQVAGSRAFFTGLDSEPWVTDGTVAGTRQVIDLNPGGGFGGRAAPAFLGAIGSDAIFSATYGPTGDRDVFRSDGTAAGTQRLGTMATANLSGVDLGSAIGGALYFAGTDQGTEGVFRTDGTPAGTVRVAAVRGTVFGAAQNRVIFDGYDPARSNELWVLDASPAGASLVLDLDPSGGTLGATLSLVTTFRDAVILRYLDPLTGYQLWSTDGTSSGTRPITALQGVSSIGAHSTDAWMLVVAYSTGPSHELWFSDGTLGGLRPLAVASRYPGFRMGQGVVLGDRVLFAARTDPIGTELWCSDGTIAGTRPMADLVPGLGSSSPRFLHRCGDRVLFVAETPATGPEPWITDGTAAGTHRIADVVPGSDGLRYLEAVAVGSQFFFAPRPFGDPNHEIWVSDGTLGGTRGLDLIPGVGGAGLAWLTPLEDQLIFAVAAPTGLQLARTDGTPAGTLLLPAPDDLRRIERISDSLAMAWFQTAEGSIAWVTDGTVAGTRELGPMPYFSASRDVAANPTDDQLVYEVDDFTYGRELFTTDGTANGTRLLIDLGLADAFPSGLMRAGDRLVTIADDGIHGTELHAFDLSLVGDETVESFGYGCPGTGGQAPRLSVEGEADASNAAGFALVADRARAQSAAVLILGTEPVAVPVAGCTVWTGGAIGSLPSATDPAGRVAWPVRAVPAMVGLSVVAQTFVADPMSGGGVAATAGLEVVLGR